MKLSTRLKREAPDLGSVVGSRTRNWGRRRGSGREQQAPEHAVGFAEQNESFRYAGEAGDLGRREEREHAELDVLGEIGEGNGGDELLELDSGNVLPEPALDDFGKELVAADLICSIIIKHFLLNQINASSLQPLLSWLPSPTP
ncbi:hypothetical protein C1H46_021312 [Malus baccata]|uniref:Uncharacterized protein n=1 Tax=Malus baccata TaxID=106549 RepID=A0A540M2T3_MALBA|nr:hypothetical protein C1H46_021312 [Malus baccata]